ncbi:MAG: hypothetical protein ACYSSK_10460 [Planctomycetota bacterium]
MKEISDSISSKKINRNQMIRIFDATHVAISIICLVFLIWSLWPGSLNEVIFIIAITAFFWIPGILFFVIHDIFKIFRQFRKNKGKAKLLSYRLGLHVLIVSCTFAILTFDIPIRIAFCISKPSFEQFLEKNQSDIRTSVYDKGISENLGIWTVDHCLKDSRGGTYFRIGNELNMIDTISYGFAFNPNDEGTPFGHVEYKTRIIGDWYFFCASDD